MPIQFKLTNKATTSVRNNVLGALHTAGYKAARLFPDLDTPSLVGIYTIAAAKNDDLPAIRTALRPFGKVVEYIEGAPNRSLKC